MKNTTNFYFHLIERDDPFTIAPLNNNFDLIDRYLNSFFNDIYNRLGSLETRVSQIEMGPFPDDDDVPPATTPDDEDVLPAPAPDDTL